jgi:hypothetical protein
VWQWWNFCKGKVADGKTVLRINLDETAVCVFQGDQKGNVFVTKKRPRDEPVQRISKGKRRCYLTHIALVCDRADLQPSLPQVVVGNERTFLAREMAALTAACPAHVRLVRQKSAWNNKDLMRRVIRWLAEALRPHMHEVQPVLFLDACKVHLAAAVFAACASSGIWAIVIPAKMTWLLQPLDTHAFRLYKARLKQFFQDARISHGVADLEMAHFLPCMYRTFREVLQGQAWSEAFDKDGFGHQQGGVSSRVLDMLKLTGPLQVSCAMPAEGQLKLCLPAKAKVATSDMLRPFLPPRRVLPKSSSRAAPELVAPAPPPAAAGPRTRYQRRVGEAVRAKASAKAVPKAYRGPLLGRTRLQHRVALAALGASAPSSSSRGT